MPDSTHQPRYGLIAWLASGGLAATAAATVAITGPGAGGGIGSAAMSVGAGVLVFVIFAPWSAVRAWRRERWAIEQLAGTLKAVGDGADPTALRELLASDLAADLGPLRPAAEAIARDVATHRRTARQMHRTLGDSIRRETHRQTIRLQKQAQTDHLTGLGNRRVLEQRLRDMAETSREDREESVVAMVIDLDHFKTVNDRLGHEAGDGCLAFVGQLLRSSVRREDTAVRLGGDEFVVLMPGQTIGTARHTAQRLSALFRQMPWPHRHVPRPSLSIGLAAAGPERLGDGRQLLRAADEALYRAKRSGRDRVESAPGDEPAVPAA
ncbi:MAG: GGDEF domain-containing protein [Planctomycetota bacterium]|jgi:diguanylate cyclase (GGDEF)-like protein